MSEKAINTHCPRSGKPVQADSLTEYKDYTVGFCNPGCRDHFEQNINECHKDTLYFDQIIENIIAE